MTSLHTRTQSKELCSAMFEVTGLVGDCFLSLSQKEAAVTSHYQCINASACVRMHMRECRMRRVECIVSGLLQSKESRLSRGTGSKCARMDVLVYILTSFIHSLFRVVPVIESMTLLGDYVNRVFQRFSSGVVLPTYHPRVLQRGMKALTYSHLGWVGRQRFDSPLPGRS
jgi:hypothetical protein